MEEFSSNAGVQSSNDKPLHNVKSRKILTDANVETDGEKSLNGDNASKEK